MKRLILLSAILLAAATGMSVRAKMLPTKPADNVQDTIIIKLPNGAGITVYVKDTKQLKDFSRYKLDSLMDLLGTYVEKVEEMEKANKGKKSKEITVTFNPSKDLKDPNAPQEIKITLSAGSVEKWREEGKSKNFEDVVKVIVDYKKSKNDKNKTDSTEIIKQAKKQAKRDRNEGYVDLGVNTFINMPENNDGIYDLKPLGSRYVSIGHLKRGHLGGATSPLYIRGGLELSFNNLMFDRNVYLVDEDGITRFETEPKTGRSFEKSKLTYSTLNLPVDFSLQFRDRRGKESFSISAGGFAGYRIGTHTKLKFQENGKTVKDKERGSFNLEDFQYGATFSIGFRDFELFGKYNLNELFKENRGPDLQVISFGFRL